MTSNKIDKASWRATVAHYRAWNEVEFLANVRNAGKKSVLQKWHEFLDLMEFGMQIKPQPSRHEQRQKMEMLNQYYQRIQRFEAWRQQHGNSSKKGVA